LSWKWNGRDILAIVRCGNSHFYNNKKYSECPYCKKAKEKENRAGETSGDAAQSQALAARESQQVTDYALAYIRSHTGGDEPQNSPQESRTEQKAAEKKRPAENRIRYTAGWLVCVSGADTGRSFPLYSGFNRIGGGSGNDIALRDETVLREECCSIVYEDRENVFYLVPKKGRNVFVDGEAEENTRELRSGQVISVGRTRLEFVAYCVGKKKWQCGAT